MARITPRVVDVRQPQRCPPSLHTIEGAGELMCWPVQQDQIQPHPHAGAGALPSTTMDIMQPQAVQASESAVAAEPGPAPLLSAAAPDQAPDAQPLLSAEFGPSSSQAAAGSRPPAAEQLLPGRQCCSAVLSGLAGPRAQCLATCLRWLADVVVALIFPAALITSLLGLPEVAAVLFYVAAAGIACYLLHHALQVFPALRAVLATAAPATAATAVEQPEGVAAV